ncbi:MAG: ABC transporter permease [Muribaculaceae bacterium]|nr:ABC transporter permease [Muribaculaceae bacterium]
MKKIFSQFIDVYLREFRLVSKDMGLILFFVFLPLAYPIIYSLIYNTEVVRDVPLVVIDHDRTARSREMTRMLDATQEAWVIGYANDLPEARRAMAQQDAFAILEIPEGFERNIGREEQAKAVMYCDMTLLLRYRGFLVAATNVMQNMSSDITIERIDNIAPLATTVAQGDPMPISNISMGNIENGFDSFIMPGVIVLILQQAVILAIGMAGGAKRERPELIGYNPVNDTKSVAVTMLAQMGCYITILIVPVIFLLHYVPLIFAFPMAGNNLEIFAFIMPMILASCGVGFMLQGVVRERESVFVIWVVTSVIFLFLSGLTWPRYAMGPVWTLISDLVPATWGVEGFIRMNTNGASLAQVQPCYIALWIQAVVYLALGYAVQRWVVRPAIRRTAAARNSINAATQTQQSGETVLNDNA